MFYYKLKGGLSNMMFGIAGVTALAIENKTQAIFTNLAEHLKYLNEDNKYNPSLKHAESYNNLNFIANLHTGTVPKEVTVRYKFPFHYTCTDLKQIPTIVDGFFQSEKYFVKYRDYMLELFAPTSSISKHIDSKYRHITDCKSTSIHVRRGDYLNLHNHHPALSETYYHQAMEHMDSETDLYVVFSDDIAWCKNQFTGDKYIFIEDIDYIELYMMSMCNNNIIANSSFSWWGAWLNTNTDKTVIGPKNWFGPSIKHTTEDILPVEWIKV